MASRRPPLDALSTRSAHCGVASEYNDIWGKAQRASDETRCAILKALGVTRRRRGSGTRRAEARDARPGASRCRRSPYSASMRVPYRLRSQFSEPQPHGDLSLAPRRSRTARRTTASSARPTSKSCNGRRSTAKHTWKSRSTGAIRCRSAITDWQLSGPALPADALAVVHRRARALLSAARARRRRPHVGRRAAALLAAFGAQLGHGRFHRPAHGRSSSGAVAAPAWSASIRCTRSFPHNPAHASPYSPSSRLFLNVLYIDVEAVPEARECADVLAIHRVTRSSSPPFRRRARPSWSTTVTVRSAQVAAPRASLPPLSRPPHRSATPSGPRRSARFQARTRQAAASSTRCSKRFRSISIARTRRSGDGPCGPSRFGGPACAGSRALRRSERRAHRVLRIPAMASRAAARTRRPGAQSIWDTPSACIRTSRSRSTAAAPKAGRIRTSMPWARASARRPTKSI